MLYMEREAFILQQLQLCANVKASELAGLMGVSLDTVRRDLKALERAGQVRCVRGGACLPESIAALAHFGGREVINLPQKRRAAVKALRHIQPGALISLNSGTTNTVLAQEIVRRFSNLTVVTNNLAAAEVLMQSQTIHTIVAGGSLDVNERSTYGHACETELARYAPDCAFLSINAVDKCAGYTDFRYYEIGVIQTLVRHAGKSVAVMDASKLGRRSKKQALPRDGVDILVMDDIPEQTRQEYLRHGITIE